MRVPPFWVASRETEKDTDHVLGVRQTKDKAPIWVVPMSPSVVVTITCHLLERAFCLSGKPKFIRQALVGGLEWWFGCESLLPGKWVVSLLDLVLADWFCQCLVGQGYVVFHL